MDLLKNPFSYHMSSDWNISPFKVVIARSEFIATFFIVSSCFGSSVPFFSSSFPCDLVTSCYVCPASICCASLYKKLC